MASTIDTSACVSCREPLILRGDADPAAGDDVIPDDLLLPCGCHFHWQCLLDEAPQVAVSISCPSCGRHLSANYPGGASSASASASASVPLSGVQILTRYYNEGGLEENYDIFPDIAEEAYILAHPEARPAQALHVMCSAGDVMGIVSLLRGGDEDDDDDDDDEMDEDGDVPRLEPDALLRYQDPLRHMQTGLHLAVENEQEEVVYLLLYLASRIPLDTLPLAVLQSAEEIGLTRPPSAASLPDIRALPNQQGETAEAIALRTGGRMAALANAGVLSA